MQMLAALVLLSVTLSAPFGEAEARAVEVDEEGMVLEVQVEIEGSALVVLARGVGSFDELPPVALAELGPGRWGGIVELPVIEDVLVGFEIIRPDGGTAIVSALNPLSELGVDPAVFAAGVATTTASAPADRAGPGGNDPSFAPIWLAIAAGAAALALLLIWWLGGGEDEADTRESPGEGGAATGGDDAAADQHVQSGATGDTDATRLPPGA